MSISFLIEKKVLDCLNVNLITSTILSFGKFELKFDGTSFETKWNQQPL